MGHMAVRSLWQCLYLGRGTHPQDVVVYSFLPQPHRKPLQQIKTVVDNHDCKDLVTVSGVGQW